MCYFDLEWRQEAKRLTWAETEVHINESAWQELSNAFFRVFLAILVSELRPHLSENVEIGQMWPLMTSGDLIFDLT